MLADVFKRQLASCRHLGTTLVANLASLAMTEVFRCYGGGFKCMHGKLSREGNAVGYETHVLPYAL